MALASANAVSPTPVAGNATGANTSVSSTGNGTGGAFGDSLAAVLSPQGASGKAAVTDASQLTFGKDTLAKLKSKLKNADPALTLTPQQLQQQQAFLQKLQSGSAGIDLSALRGAMANGTSQAAHQALPVVDPVTGRVTIAKHTTSSKGQDPTQGVAANSITATDEAFAASATAAQTSAPNNSAAAADQTKIAAHAASQTKLAAALVKAAQAPVVKGAQADGSKVPNTKLANGKVATQAPADTDNALTDPAAVAALGAKIAATAGATNAQDAAHVADRNVALAQVASQQAGAKPTVTKLESAAMTNAAQVATHQTTPEQKVEAQALPVQFGAQQADPKDSNGNAQGGNGGTSDKSPSQSGNARAENIAQKPADAPAPQAFFANPQQPAAPDHSAANTTNVNLDAGNGNTAATAPLQTAHVTAALQVSPQQPQSDPTPDQTTFAALGVAIAARSKDGAKQFDINMHPADLGKIDVRISVDTDGKAQAHLTAEHPQTLQLLKQDQTTLERNLRDAGLNLANNGLNFSLKGEQQSSTPTFNARSRALSIAAVQTPDIVSTSSSANVAPGDSRLDIRV